MKLVVLVVLALTLWQLVEQILLGRRPWWMARLALLPLGHRSFPLAPQQVERARVGKDAAYREPAVELDTTRLSWPVAWARDGVELNPPSANRPAWARIVGDKRRGFVGVVCLSLRVAEGSKATPVAIVRARLYPATLLWTAGIVALVSSLVLLLAPLHVGIVVVTAVTLLWLYPVWSAVQRTRARLEPLLDHLVDELGAGDDGAPAGRPMTSV